MRLATYAIVGCLFAVAVEAVVGVGALQVGIAAVLVAMVGREGSLRTRLVHMGGVTLVGGAFGFMSYITAETAGQAALVLAVVSYVTGMAYGLGPAAGRAGYLLLLWAMAVLIGQSRAEDPPVTAAAFLLGGVVAMVVVAVVFASERRRGRDAPVTGDDESLADCRTAPEEPMRRHPFDRPHDTPTPGCRERVVLLGLAPPGVAIAGALRGLAGVPESVESGGSRGSGSAHR